MKKNLAIALACLAIFAAPVIPGSPLQVAPAHADGCANIGLVGSTVVVINNCSYTIIGNYDDNHGNTGGFGIIQPGHSSGIYAMRGVYINLRWCEINDWNANRCRF